MSASQQQPQPQNQHYQEQQQPQQPLPLQQELHHQPIPAQVSSQSHPPSSPPPSLLSSSQFLGRYEQFAECPTSSGNLLPSHLVTCLPTMLGLTRDYEYSLDTAQSLDSSSRSPFGPISPSSQGAAAARLIPLSPHLAATAPLAALAVDDSRDTKESFTNTPFPPSTQHQPRSTDDSARPIITTEEGPTLQRAMPNEEASPKEGSDPRCENSANDRADSQLGRGGDNRNVGTTSTPPPSLFVDHFERGMQCLRFHQRKGCGNCPVFGETCAFARIDTAAPRAIPRSTCRYFFSDLGCHREGCTFLHGTQSTLQLLKSQRGQHGTYTIRELLCYCSALIFSFRRRTTSDECARV